MDELTIRQRKDGKYFNNERYTAEEFYEELKESVHEALQICGLWQRLFNHSVVARAVQFKMAGKFTMRLMNKKYLRGK